jgi:hypothetical protein
MEINITHMVKDSDHMPLLSGSQFELGDQAAEITWDNCCQYAYEFPLLLTPEDVEAGRDYFRSYGVWEKRDIDDWDPATIQALVVQEVAKRIRELENYDSKEEYLADENMLYRDDCGQWFFYLGW